MQGGSRFVMQIHVLEEPYIVTHSDHLFKLLLECMHMTSSTANIFYKKHLQLCLQHTTTS
jgi:hypothetical protein